MAKKTISRLSVLAVLIVFLAACSKTSEYTNVIPADASVVASINLKSLASKAGLDDKENEAAKQKVLEALKSGMNAATFQQLEKVMKNPGESGINVESPFYVFSSSSFPYPTVVGKVNNEDKLHASLDVMAKEQICQPVGEADGYSFTTMNSGLLVFNSSTILVVNVSGTTQTDKAKESITNLLKQTASNSIVKSGAFQKMEKQKSDINFFASMTAIPSTYRDQITMGLPTEVKAEDITLIGGLNFEKGKIALKTENYTENEAVKTLLKKQMESVGKANNTFVKYFPASTLMFFNVGVKGGELYNLLSENKEFRNTVSIAKADEVKELFSSFNGDISAGLINVTMSSAPTFMMYADVKNGNALEMIYKNKESLGLKRGEDIMQLGKDEYVYKTRGMNIFFGIKDKQMYATNDELLYKNVGKAADKSVKDAPYASDMKGKSLFIAINAEAILDLPIVKMVAGFGGQEAKTYIELANKVSYLSMSSEGEVSEIDLCLKDKDVNALKQIVDFAKQTLPQVFADRNSVTSDVWHQDLFFRKGEMYLIEAASGTGKSSLCSYIYGYRNDYQGIINFDETNIKAYSVKQWVDLRKHSLSMLFQDLRIFTELSALENVQLKNNLTGCKKKKEILSFFEQLGIADKINVKAGKLSFGQQQRVAFIRALCQPFDFLFLDEPISHLDDDNSRIMGELIIAEAKAQGAGVIATSIGKHIELPYNHTLQL